MAERVRAQLKCEHGSPSTLTSEEVPEIRSEWIRETAVCLRTVICPSHSFKLGFLTLQREPSITL